MIKNCVLKIKDFFAGAVSVVRKLKLGRYMDMKYFSLKAILITLAIAYGLTLVLEGVARTSLGSLWTFYSERHALFIYNVLLLGLFLYVGRFFAHRVFAVVLIGGLWLVLSVVNAILLTLRPSPLTLNDFKVFTTAYGLATSYITIPEMILLGLAAVFFIGYMVYIFINTEKVKVNYIKEVIGFCTIAAVFAIYSLVGYSTEMLSINYNRIDEAYNQNGFVYCFCDSVVGQGITKPQSYVPSNIKEYLDALPEVNEVNEEDLPNIVFVQLESFFDLKAYDTYTVSQDPVPNFTYLKENYPTGVLDVPVYGGGTANTEFEVLCGMKLDDFGGGEYPYSTIIKDNTCESIPYILKDYGYTSTAIHNHYGSFYSRNHVYGNLGFDYFVSREYMQQVPVNKVGWAKDIVLTDHIFKAIEKTPGKDFVFAVSVEGHGGYPKVDEGFDIPLTLSNDDGSEKAFSVRYYANMVYEMDRFIGEVVERAEALDEKTVIVFYGDHMPYLSFDSEELEKINTFQTEYVVYSNFDFDFEATQLESYQLSSEILGALSINSGLINRVNQSRELFGEDYGEVLLNIQYDVLYGDNYSGARNYKRVETKMGLEDVVITKCVYDGRDLRVDCKNSTYCSFIYLNGRQLPTKYYNEEMFLCDNPGKIRAGDIVTICQVSDTGVVIGESAPYIFD